MLTVVLVRILKAKPDRAYNMSFIHKMLSNFKSLENNILGLLKCSGISGDFKVLKQKYTSSHPSLFNVNNRNEVYGRGIFRCILAFGVTLSMSLMRKRFDQSQTDAQEKWYRNIVINDTMSKTLSKLLYQ